MYEEGFKECPKCQIKNCNNNAISLVGTYFMCAEHLLAFNKKEQDKLKAIVEEMGGDCYEK